MSCRLRAGALCWAFTLGYFAIEPIVAIVWPAPYSFVGQTISDLGAVGCGDRVQFGGEPVWVCSPWHALMNATFVVYGTVTAAGAVLTRELWPRRRLAGVAVAFVVLAGVGGVAVGLAPQDTQLGLHAGGALLQLPGTVAPLLLAPLVWADRRWLGVVSLVCGVVGVAGTALFFGLAGSEITGLLERLALWPLTMWTGVIGLGLLSRSR